MYSELLKLSVSGGNNREEYKKEMERLDVELVKERYLNQRLEEIIFELRSRLETAQAILNKKVSK